MCTMATSYHYEIITSERIMHVFGTVMSHSDESVLMDLWCPEEPCLTQKVNVACHNIRENVEVLIQERMRSLFVAERMYTISCISY